MLEWAQSNQIGNLTEITVMVPIRTGLVRNHDGGHERRTYEEKLRSEIANLDQRSDDGYFHSLDRVASIHMGRMTIIRPEHYLLYSKLDGVRYHVEDGRRIPRQFEGYSTNDSAAPGAEEAEGNGSEADPQARSFLLTQVVFHGDLRTYFRQIAEFVESDFDRIFRNCEDFPSTKDFEAFWLWIRRFQLRADLLYNRYSHLSVPRILELERFKQRFDEFLSTLGTGADGRIECPDALFDQFVKENLQISSDWPSADGVYKNNRD